MSGDNQTSVNGYLVITEVVIDADSVSFVALNMIGHTVSCVLCVSKPLVDIICQFDLQKKGLSALTIPLNLVMECMLS